MYCPVCGTIVLAGTQTCEKCSTTINPLLFDFEPERTKKQLKKQDVKSNRKFAFLAYIGPLVIISLLKSKTSDFVKFHTNQGLIVAICLIISLLSYMVPNFGNALGFALTFVSLALSVLGIINVIKGEETEIPIIGKYKILK